jgi:hypothetical protein
VQLPPETPRDVIDIVVIVDGLLIAIEAKFFSATKIADITAQLASQREALRRLEEWEDCKISAVCQVFLTADPAVDSTKLGDVGVLHWSDIHALAECLRGSESYIAQRLRSALERYELEFPAGVPGPHWAGVEGLEAVLRRCRTHGPKVVVGFTGGLTVLKNQPKAKLASRPFRWDWVDTGRGRKDWKNWIPGDQFVAAIGELRSAALS